MFRSILNRKQHQSFLAFEAECEVRFLGIRLLGNAQYRSLCNSEVHPEFVSRGHEDSIVRYVAGVSRRRSLLLRYSSPAETRNEEAKSSHSGRLYWAEETLALEFFSPGDHCPVPPVRAPCCRS